MFYKDVKLTTLYIVDSVFGVMFSEICFKEKKGLAKVLCKNITLTSLDRSYNEFGSKDGKDLVNSLRKNVTLTILIFMTITNQRI
ncbi:hypothetical protein C2G38_2226374 [Gigaspora rosea]|uniref:Uncharacterized protein n=1 Tax=Gigaspora rosea TaxID=44941 RepID=A0A397U2G7_9GLOM|nr:hypothetical protein C2G38_2226374 [Gigaspora rosea]